MSMMTPASMTKEQSSMDANLGDRLVGWAALFIAGFLLALMIWGA